MKKRLILGDLVARANECKVKKWRKGTDEDKDNNNGDTAKNESGGKDENKNESGGKNGNKNERGMQDKAKNEYIRQDKVKNECSKQDKVKNKSKCKDSNKNERGGQDRGKNENSDKNANTLAFASKKAYLKGFAWAYEKFKKEPYFVNEDDKKPYYDKLRLRVAKCPHLAEHAYIKSLATLPRHFKDTLEQQHSPALWRKDAPFYKEQILAPQLSEKEYVLWAKFCLQKAYGAFDEMQTTQKDIDKLSELLDEIYALESECFKTHEALVRLSEPFKVLDNFKHNEVKFTGEHCFFRGYIYTKPIYEIISTYPFSAFGGRWNTFEYSYADKYDLLEYDESILKDIEPMKRHLKECQGWIDESTAWLDERISSQKDFKPRLVLDNPIPSDAERPFFDFIMDMEQRKELLDNIAKERSVMKQADFAKFTSDEKERIEQIVQKAKQIQELITRYRFIYRLRECDDVEKLPFPFNFYD